MHIDRLLTLNLFGPLVRHRPIRGLRIPILMYHSISDEPEAGHPYYWINTSPALFAEHMKFLYDNNYQVISLSTAVEIIQSGNPNFKIQNSNIETLNSKRGTVPPRSTDKFNELIKSNNPIGPINQTTSQLKRPDRLNKQKKQTEPHFVVLTFDDGYRDFLTNGFPVLKGHGFSATVFLPTAFIDKAGPGLRDKRHLCWDEVRDLQSKGIVFGSHTVDHPQLHDLKVQDVEYQVRKSKEIIEEKTGCTVESFCYPYRFTEQDKHFVGMLADILRQAYYRNAVTTRVGSVHDPADTFRLKRLTINSGDDQQFFRAKLRGGYDWIRQLQNLTKAFRRKKRDSAVKPLSGKSS